MLTIHNKGQRIIQFEGGVLKPNSFIKVEEKTARYLKSLFEGEITIIEEVASAQEVIQAPVVTPVVAPAPIVNGDEVELESLNKNQLLAIAQQMGLNIGEKATRKDIIALIEDAKTPQTSAPVVNGDEVGNAQ